MTNATASTTTPAKKDLVKVVDANEWGQIADLEPRATYFVIRKPTREMTKERSQEFVADVRAFLHEHRVLTDKQVEELNTRYGEPAKQKAKELRETMEKKFDEIAKEFESRVEQLENEINTRLGRNDKATATETPGEMPKGDGASSPAASTKKASKKSE